MKILVTGGLGFIGINFILFALKKGHSIINVDKITYASNKKKKFLKNFNNYKFYKADITNKSKIKKIIRLNLPNYVVNFAAETHVDRSIINSKNFIRTNILGVYSILECLKDLQKIKKIKLIHISTDEVYGSLRYTGSFKEGDAYKPNSPYSASKAAADQLVRSYRKTYSIPSIIVHPSNNFGPYQNQEKLIPKTIINCIKKKIIPVYDKGLQIRDWLYVEDTVRAIHKIILKGKIGENYNISTKNEFPNIKLVNKICQIFNKNSKDYDYRKLIKFIKDRPAHDFRYSLKNTKLKSIGWKYDRNFENKLFETINWYLSKNI